MIRSGTKTEAKLVHAGPWVISVCCVIVVCSKPAYRRRSACRAPDSAPCRRRRSRREAGGIRTLARALRGGLGQCTMHTALLGRGDDTVGNPHRAQIVQFELFERILLLKLEMTSIPRRATRGNRISVNSTLSPPLNCTAGSIQHDSV